MKLHDRMQLWDFNEDGATIVQQVHGLDRDVVMPLSLRLPH